MCSPDQWAVLHEQAGPASSIGSLQVVRLVAVVDLRVSVGPWDGMAGYWGPLEGDLMVEVTTYRHLDPLVGHFSCLHP
jgi:hypothetical protein